MKIRDQLPRVLIFIVLFFNLQCAILFLWTPEAYIPGFELNGVPGRALIQGMGILFLMWSVPYCTALIHPVRHKISLFEAVIMQAIGVVGESILFLQISNDHFVLRNSGLRFILFDAGGLVLLLISMGLVIKSSRKLSQSDQIQVV
jgi:hypothetical protein